MPANFLKRISPATLVAIAALALAGAAWLRSAPRASPVSSGNVDRGVADGRLQVLQAQVAALTNELNTLRMAVARNSAVAVGAGAEHTAGAPAPLSDDKMSEAPKAPMVRNDAPKGLTLTEAAPGAWSVRNTDPAMAGQVKLISVQRADGTTENVSIIVPDVQR